MAAQASGTAVDSSGGTAGGMRETGRRDLREFEHQNIKLNRGNDATVIRLQQFSTHFQPPFASSDTASRRPLLRPYPHPRPRPRPHLSQEVCSCHLATILSLLTV